MAETTSKDPVIGDTVFWIHYCGEVHGGRAVYVSENYVAAEVGPTVIVMERKSIYKQEIDAQLASAQRLMAEAEAKMRQANELFSQAAKARELQ